jgi:hypothetical protein
MTNFLHRLAGRTLGMVPVAQPIVPTQFHPLVEQRRGADGLIEDGVESSSSSDLSSGTRKIRRIRSVKTAGRAATTLPGDLSRDEAEQRALPDHAEGPRAPHREEAASRARFVMESSADAAHEAQQKEDRHVVLVRNEVGLAQKAVQSAAPDPQESNGRGPESQRGVFIEQRRVSPSATRSRRAEPHTRTPVASAAQATDAPAVRVTIGRIDIRAEAAASSAPVVSRRPRAATLSLEQYLKQRSEVRR